MQQVEEWYNIKNADEIDTPALVVYPQRVKANISLLKSMIDDHTRLRPHVKTHKTKEATLLMLEAGIRKFKCATIAEAEMLALCQAPDVLLAYQPVGPKLLRFVALIKKYPQTQFSCLTDNLSAATQLAKVACEQQIHISVFIDLNIGMNRTGITPGAKAIELYRFCMLTENMQVVGLHAYDGHIHAVGLQQRNLECNEGFKPVEQLVNTLKEKGFPEPLIIAGGSPTFPVHAKRQGVECSPGTFIFWDKSYQDTIPEQPFLPAAFLLTRVISFPDSETICLDLGHKAVAAENSLSNRVYFLNAPDLEIISQSEEHLVVKAPEDYHFKMGDILYGLPYHICPTCNLYDRLETVEAGAVTGSWEVIGRHRKITV